MKSTVLAIVPARADSKRIPGKNTKEFLGKPLIQWAIEAGVAADSVTDVVVTTDDEKILALAPKYSEVEFIRRPPELAKDTTPGVDPVLHLMRSYAQSYDYVVLLQPTSPLRTATHIDTAFAALVKSGKDQLVSVKKLTDPLAHIVYCEGETLEFLKATCSQIPDEKNLRVLNGAIYISKWQTLIEKKSFLGAGVEMFEMDEFFSVDIDFPADWRRAEVYARLERLDE